MDENADRDHRQSTCPEPVAEGRAIAPHPPLPQYYGDASQRLSFLQGLFDRTARHYDGIGRLLSLGLGDWYRRRTLHQAGLRAGMRVLDVAVGTGAVARAAIAVGGPSLDLVGIDLSFGMLAEARRHLAIPLVRGRMEQLPFADASIDFLSMGYALRHVADLAVAFAEFRRVLRPGGTLVLLELGKPSTPRREAIARFYLGRLIPRLGRWLSGNAEAETLMRYYWDTIDQCVPPETILGVLVAAGFADVRCVREFDVFRAYIGARH